MRGFLLTPFFLLASSSALAQVMMTTYDLSPNWTATDINGNSHTLYEYLDDGYTVVIDFSTTWCPPCQEFHWSHTLNDLYNAYGPGTPTDKVMVFLVEIDPTTDMADLQGIGDQGSLDWITGTDYPIIDDAAIGEVYGVFGYPTIYTICPTRMIAAMGYTANVDYMWGQCRICEHHEVDSPHDATLLGTVDQIDCREVTTPLHTVLFNVGTAPLTDATIEAVNTYDSTVVSAATWAGSLNTYQQADVYLPAWAAPPGQQSVYYRLSSSDDDSANDSTLAEAFYAQSPSSPGTEVTIEILTDDHGESVNWRLADAFGLLIDRRDEGDYADNTLYTHTYTLPVGTCWEFVIYNMSSDGFESPGYYRLHSDGTTFITTEDTWQTVTPGVSFFHRAHFKTQSTIGMNDTDRHPMTILPNPASDLVTITPIEPGSYITFRDAAGRLIRSERHQGSNLAMDVSELPDGVYLVTAAGMATTTTRTLVIMR